MAIERPSRRSLLAWSGIAAAMTVFPAPSPLWSGVVSRGDVDLAGATLWTPQGPVRGVGIRARAGRVVDLGRHLRSGLDVDGAWLLPGVLDGARTTGAGVPAWAVGGLEHGGCGHADLGAVWLRIDGDQECVGHGVCLGRDALGGSVRSRIEALFAARRLLRTVPNDTRLFVRADRSDDIAAALELTRGRRSVVLVGGTGAAQHVKTLSQRSFSVVLAPPAAGDVDPSAARDRARAAAALVDQGVATAFGSTMGTDLRGMARDAVAEGMTEAQAMRTLFGGVGQVLGRQTRGRLTVGGPARFVVVRGSPLAALPQVWTDRTAEAKPAQPTLA